MTDLTTQELPERPYWMQGNVKRIAVGLSGVLAVVVALKATAYTSGVEAVFPMQDHVFRLISFASLTIWATLTMGVRRRGFAAILVLAFASFLELVIVPARGIGMGTLASANLGIVAAYAGLQVYWYRVVKARRS